MLLCSHHQDSPESLPRAAGVGGLLQPAKAVLVHLEGELVCLQASCIIGSRSAAILVCQQLLGHPVQATMLLLHSTRLQLLQQPLRSAAACCHLDTRAGNLAATTCCCHAATSKCLPQGSPLAAHNPVACGRHSLPGLSSFELSPVDVQLGAGLLVHRTLCAFLTTSHALQLCGSHVQTALLPSYSCGMKQFRPLASLFR